MARLPWTILSAFSRASSKDFDRNRVSNFIVDGRVASDDCSPEAPSRTGQGDFRHTVPPLASRLSSPYPHHYAKAKAERKLYGGRKEENFHAGIPYAW